MIKHLLLSWKESLSLFLPKNATLFFLVVVKTLISTYKNAFFYGWWAFALGLLGSGYLIAVPLIFSPYIKLIWLCSFWFYFIIVSARPSIKLKGLGYYKDYLLHAAYLIFFMILLHAVMQLLVAAACKLAYAHCTFFSYALTLALHPIVFALFFTFDLYAFFLSPWIIFFALFLSDSLPRAKRFALSPWRALKMVFYNYPWCAIMYILFRGIIGIVASVLQSIGLSSILSNAIMLALLPIPIVVITCFYTKRLHDQFGYYFYTHERK